MEVPAPLPRPDEPSWLHLPWDRVGLVAGPAVMVGWLLLDRSPSFTPEAHRLCGVLLLTIIWWLTGTCQRL
jgi:hypothetical protein